MFRIIKRTVSLRRFFWVSTTCAFRVEKLDLKKNNNIYLKVRVCIVNACLLIVHETRNFIRVISVLSEKVLVHLLKKYACDGIYHTRYRKSIKCSAQPRILSLFLNSSDKLINA